MKTLLLLLLGAISAFAGEATVTYRIIGLFSPDRQADLRVAMESVAGVELVSVDFDHAEAAFRYDPATVFRTAQPGEIIERLNNAVRAATNHTIGVAACDPAPKEKLERVEIPVFGLDCKACCFAAYEAIAKIDGVTQATADFKAGRVCALIDPMRADRDKIVAALKARGVTLEAP